MSRSVIVFALFSVFLPLSAGCGREPLLPLDGIEGVQIVARLDFSPGFWGTSQFNAIRPTDLLVYSDGLVVREARQFTRLSPAETEKLVGQLVRELPAEVTDLPDETTMPSDSSTLNMSVYVAGEGMRRISLYAYGYGASEMPEKYPKGIHDAYARLNGITTDMPYTSDRVRVVTKAWDPSKDTSLPHDQAVERILDWPKDAPRLDPAPGLDGVHVNDLSGKQALAAVAHLPRYILKDGTYEWQRLNHPTRGVLMTSWRYLVLGE
ncbi:hypothetical protein [Streptosporangium sp. NPDC002607]